MKKFSSCLASLLTVASTAAAQASFPALMDKDRDATLPTSPASADRALKCDKPDVAGGERPFPVARVKPDLKWPGIIAMTTQAIDPTEETVHLEFVTLLDNQGICDADTSRVKAILTFDGGRWLGEDRVNIAVSRLSYETVLLSFDMPLEKVANDCTLTRDDWVLTLYADYRGAVDEWNEGNNEWVVDTISTASDNFCPKTEDDDIPRKFDLPSARKFRERPSP
ncbi:MAG: hypothetical protein ACWA5T_09715 [Parvularcula sp.]